MTVWTKLQSWLGAAASDVAIDNEFNNIYLGLNEAANGNLPSGYNDVELAFTGASLTVKGETKIGNINVSLDSTLTVTGAAGWRYIVSTNGGVVSVESIPPAEIVADTQVYTPKPVFNASANGYYSTVNTSRRIVGICYFDSTDILEAIAYGSGKNKRDSYLYGFDAGSPYANIIFNRLQFTGALTKSRGDISLVDNGAGTTSAEGMRITNNANKPLTFFGSIGVSCPAGGTLQIAVQKNGVDAYLDVLQINNTVSATTFSGLSNFTYTDIYSKKDDFYQLYIKSTLAASGALIQSIGANHVSV